MATTWNPADKSADITLSNGDLTALSAASGHDCARNTTSKTSGKWYWEITSDYDSGNIGSVVGIGTVASSLESAIGSEASSYGYRSNGQKGNSNSFVPYGDTWTTADIIGIALDMDAGKIWFSKNGVWQALGDPAAGTGEAFSGISGTIFSMFSLYYLNEQLTVNFGAEGLSYSAPSGFSKWDTYDIAVTNPSMTAEGQTGMQSDITLPMATAEGFTGIYSAPSIPMIRANGTLSDNMVHIEADVTIPSMTASITQAKQIWGAVSVPMMTAEITERETVLGNVTVPMMTASLSSGSHANVSATIPMMTAAGLFSGRCAVTVPMMTAALTGKVGRVGNISVKLPMMTVSVTGKTEHLGNISVTVPMMLALAELITGKVITGAVTLPMMTAALSSYEDLTGDIDVSIPMMVDYLSGTTARFTSCAVVLRYIEPV